MKVERRRRDFITLLGGAAAAWPLAAKAQQPAVPVVGFLSTGSGRPSANVMAAVSKGLSEMGFVEGRNVAFEYRGADDHYDRFPALARELVNRQVAVILTSSNVEAARAAKAATATIPIVFAVGADPVRVGIVTSFNKPGGNATGVTFYANALEPKQLQMLRELVPQAANIGVLINPASVTSDENVADIQAAARSMGQQIIVLKARTDDEIDTAVAIAVEQRVGALLIVIDAFMASHIPQLAALMTRHKIPASLGIRGFAEAGGLMSYSDDRMDTFRQAGIYLGRVLKGEKPADLPVLQPTRFDLVINLKTATTLGLTVPPTLLVFATEVIE